MSIATARSFSADAIPKTTKLQSEFTLQEETDVEYQMRWLNIRQQTLPKNHSAIVTTYVSLGQAYTGKMVYTKAIEFYHKALDLNVESYGENHPETAAIYYALSQPHVFLLQYDKALDYLQRALVVYKADVADFPQETAVMHTEIGRIHKARNEYGLALESYSKALEIFEDNRGRIPLSNKDIIGTYIALGQVHAARGDFTKAVTFLKKDAPPCSQIDGALAGLFATQGQLQNAIVYYKSALEKLSTQEKLPSVELERAQLHADLGQTYGVSISIIFVHICICIYIYTYIHT